MPVGILRRNRDDDAVNVPTATATDAEREAAGRQISAALSSELAGQAHELDGLPEPALGFGPDVFRFSLVTTDPPWPGTSFLARLGGGTALEREAAWARAVGAAGFPTPEPLLVAPDAGVLVLPEPPGVTLTEAMLVDMVHIPRFLTALGQLHARLHETPADAVPDGSTDVSAGALLAERAGTDMVRSALAEEVAWLAGHTPAARGKAVVCHGELHPSHVYMDPAEPEAAALVNWSTARLAEPELDVAGTMVAFWFSPYYVDNAMYRKGLSMAVGPIVDAYLKAYREGASQPLDDDALRYWQAFQVALLAADVAHLVHHGPRHGWDAIRSVIRPERTLDDLHARFRELTSS
jgi:aminoglycoside phosphotransferase (APT) family kinase protein